MVFLDLAISTIAKGSFEIMGILQRSGRTGQALLLLALLSCASTGWAKQPMNTFSLQVVDTRQASTIGITVEGEFDEDFPPPRVASLSNADNLDMQHLSALSGELLYAELGFFGHGIFRHVRGDLGVTVRLRKSSTSGLDAHQLHQETTLVFAKDGKKSAMGS